ncbi:TIGR03757 family integrating conjugative element protein [Haemophilus paracuniculus]|uniref:TIGR03757 family integrating conjugative element protein n=1 Tax=Haemophilus paracuniculus TaxID=734 RepID=UPI0009946DF2|nr:TIGR03757 family integrating conjugative element protein [Haemophilus paracuniculus]
MRYLSLLTLFVASNPVWANSVNQLENTKVVVYTTSNYPLEQKGFADQIYFLDEVEKLEEAFGKALSENPATAEKQAQALLQSEQGKQFQARLQQAYQGIADGWRNGVMKVPAVVFYPENAEPLVIYGETNVAKAVQRYKSRF